MRPWQGYMQGLAPVDVSPQPWGLHSALSGTRYTTQTIHHAHDANYSTMRTCHANHSNHRHQTELTQPEEQGRTPPASQHTASQPSGCNHGVLHFLRMMFIALDRFRKEAFFLIQHGCHLGGGGATPRVLGP